MFPGLVPVFNAANCGHMSKAMTECSRAASKIVIISLLVGDNSSFRLIFQLRLFDLERGAARRREPACLYFLRRF